MSHKSFLPFVHCFIVGLINPIVSIDAANIAGFRIVSLLIKTNSMLSTSRVIRFRFFHKGKTFRTT